MSESPLLKITDLSVSFGGIRALDGVSLSVDEGRMVGLIGPNGAGKSTLIAAVSGLLRPQGGTATYEGMDLFTVAAHRRVRMGVTRTFQRLELWPSMTVFENVLTAGEFAARFRTDFNARDSANEVIDTLGLRQYANSDTADLPSGIGRLVEVGRALVSRPRLMLLDEPSAGLDSFESANLATVLAATAANGVAILLVEHHVEMVLKHCSEIYVLDFGRLIAHGPPSEVAQHEAVRTAYLGSRSGTSV